jgi:hypothetical protein
VAKKHKNRIIRSPDTEEALRIAKRRMEIARMYLQGKAQIEIAEKMGLATTTVCNDLLAMREEWAEKALLDFDKRKAEELAKLDRLETVAWAAWERSAEDARILRERREFIRERVPSKGKNKNKHRLVAIGKTQDDTVKGQCGDPRFLEQVERCILLRMRVLGIMKNESGNVMIQNIDFSSLVGRQEGPDEVEQKILAVQHSTGITTQPKHLTLMQQVESEARRLEDIENDSRNEG